MPIISGYLYQAPNLLFDTEPLVKDCICLFGAPLGQHDLLEKSKLLQQTNMFLPQTLPNPEKFIVNRMLCALLDESGGLVPLSQDVPEWSQIALSLEIGLRTFVTGPAWMFAHPMAVFCGMKVDPTTAAVGLAAWQDAILSLNEIVEQQQRFCVRVDCAKNISRRLSIVGILQGQHFRAVC